MSLLANSLSKGFPFQKWVFDPLLERFSEKNSNQSSQPFSRVSKRSPNSERNW